MGGWEVGRREGRRGRGEGGGEEGVHTASLVLYQPQALMFTVAEELARRARARTRVKYTQRVVALFIPYPYPLCLFLYLFSPPTTGRKLFWLFLSVATERNNTNFEILLDSTSPKKVVYLPLVKFDLA